MCITEFKITKPLFTDIKVHGSKSRRITEKDAKCEAIHHSIHQQLFNTRRCDGMG